MEGRRDSIGSRSLVRTSVRHARFVLAVTGLGLRRKLNDDVLAFVGSKHRIVVPELIQVVRRPGAPRALELGAGCGGPVYCYKPQARSRSRVSIGGAAFVQE